MIEWPISFDTSGESRSYFTEELILQFPVPSKKTLLFKQGHKCFWPLAITCDFVLFCFYYFIFTPLILLKIWIRETHKHRLTHNMKGPKVRSGFISHKLLFLLHFPIVREMWRFAWKICISNTFIFWPSFPLLIQADNHRYLRVLFLLAPSSFPLSLNWRHISLSSYISTLPCDTLIKMKCFLLSGSVQET